MPKKPLTGITLKEETYWKFLNVKVRLKCKTWEEFAEKIEKIVEKIEEVK